MYINLLFYIHICIIHKKLTLFLKIQVRSCCRVDHAVFRTIKLGNVPKTSCKSLGQTHQLCLHGGHCLKILNFISKMAKNQTNQLDHINNVEIGIVRHANVQPFFVEHFEWYRPAFMVFEVVHQLCPILINLDDFWCGPKNLNKYHY